MSRHKQKRFSETKLMENIMEPGKAPYLEMAGRWGPDFFQNEAPVVLELACGKGEYTYGLSKAFPEKNFIGMDIKGSRMYIGAKACEREDLKNAAFLRGKIQNLRTFFGWREVSEIWITFPDPRPRNKDEKRRLTFSRFLQLYQHVLKEEGIVHLKTDSRPLMDFTVESVEAFGGNILALTHDLYNSIYKSVHFGIKTHYETLFSEKGFSINYCRFKLPVLPEPLGPPDPIYTDNGDLKIFP